jgi:hypothetical protein
MWKSILIWIACVVVGAIAGFLLGAILWAFGFEFLGSTLAIIGAGFGGILVLFLYLRRTEAW